MTTKQILTRRILDGYAQALTQPLTSRDIHIALQQLWAIAMANGDDAVVMERARELHNRYQAVN